MPLPLHPYHIGRMVTSRVVVFAAVLCVAAAVSPLDGSLPKSARNPRLFFASISSSTTTSTSTTTLSTATFCYTGSPTAACGRKKRSIFEDPLTGAVENLKPSTPARHAREVPLEASEDNKKASNRNAKLFLLLTSTSTITATATSTTTAYTGTATISVLCTPGSIAVWISLE